MLRNWIGSIIEPLFVRLEETIKKSSPRPRPVVACDHSKNEWTSVFIDGTSSSLCGVKCKKCGVFMPCNMVPKNPTKKLLKEIRDAIYQTHQDVRLLKTSSDEAVKRLEGRIAYTNLITEEVKNSLERKTGNAQKPTRLPVTRRHSSRPTNRRVR